MGDVMAQARSLCKEAKEINIIAISESQHLDEFANELEQSFNQKSGGEKSKTNLLEVKKTWMNKKKSLNTVLSKLKSRRHEILLNRDNIKDNEVDISDNEEYQRLNNLLDETTEKLGKISSTKNAIDQIVEENRKMPKDNLDYSNDVEFLCTNYFNFIKSKIYSDNIYNPITRDVYSKSDLIIDDYSKFRFAIKVKTTIFKPQSPIDIDVRFLLHAEEKDCGCEECGAECIDLINDFINSNNFKTFDVMVLASSVEWGDEIKNRVDYIISENQLIFLVNVLDGTILSNRCDAASYVVDLFAPSTLPSVSVSNDNL